MKRTDLNQLLSLFSGEVRPELARGKFLAWFCKYIGVKSAFLIVDGKTCRRGRIRVVDEQTLNTQLSRSSESKQHRGRLSLYRFPITKKQSGILGWDGAGSHGADLQNILKLLSLFEQKQKLQELLEITQTTLGTLSHQSASIAQNNSRLFEKLDSNMRRLQTMSKGVIRMQEAERAKISRELHDGIGQTLTALKMNLDFVVKDISTSISEASRQHLEDAANMTEQSLAEVRELSRLLRPRMLDDLGLLATLQWAARTFSKRTGIKIKLDSNGSNPRIDPEIETMIFRITQEALNNIAKHSQAKSAIVQFQCSTRRIRLIIRDDGVGFDIPRQTGIHADDFGSGLAGIRDRVTLWGGQFHIHSERESGTTLQIELPGYGRPQRSPEYTGMKSNG